MDVIQAARELGRAIQQDERYRAMMRAQKENDGDLELQKMIADFNAMRSELNGEVQKKEKDDGRLKELDASVKALYREIFANGNMIAFTEARGEMQTMMDYVNQILSASANGQDPDTVEYQESCGGNCSGCSGCS